MDGTWYFCGMNIFYTNKSPEISAYSLCDKHVVKMSLESAQMLTNCFSEDILALPTTPKTQKGTPRKYSHWNHPSSIWVRQSKPNMQWLLDHAIAICHEKHRRYPDKPLPFIYGFLKWTEANFFNSQVPDGDFTEPPQCMPDDCKVEGDSISAYRNYYNQEKADIATWKNAEIPWWFKKTVEIG